jgi:RNA polymerase sigma factor (sigma-70 family)
MTTRKRELPEPDDLLSDAGAASRGRKPHAPRAMAPSAPRTRVEDVDWLEEDELIVSGALQSTDRDAVIGALTGIVPKLQPALWSTACRANSRYGNGSLADVSDDVFDLLLDLRLLALTYTRSDKRNFRNWCCSNLWNRIRNRCRNERHHRALQAKWQIHLAAGTDDTSERESEELTERRKIALRAAMERLSPKVRRVMSLRAEGLSNGEISGVLGVSVECVRARFHRGLVFLRKQLSGLKHVSR